MRKGFTLIELLIVVIIIGILASIGFVQYGQVIEKSRAAEAYSVLADIVAAERAYFVENDAYTKNFSDLHSFTAAPTSNNFFYNIPLDTTKGYASAERKESTGGRMSYSMCLKSGLKMSCDGDQCVPGCT